MCFIFFSPSNCSCAQQRKPQKGNDSRAFQRHCLCHCNHVHEEGVGCGLLCVCPFVTLRNQGHQVSPTGMWRWTKVIEWAHLRCSNDHCPPISSFLYEAFNLEPKGIGDLGVPGNLMSMMMDWGVTWTSRAWKLPLLVPQTQGRLMGEQWEDFWLRDSDIFAACGGLKESP